MARTPHASGGAVCRPPPRNLIVDPSALRPRRRGSASWPRLHAARLFGQNDAQQGAMDLEVAVVADETHLTKLVHEMADARSWGADHLGERLLADLRCHGLRPALLAKIRQQQEHPGQSLLGRVEELIDQVRFDSGIPRQDMRDEHLGECGLVPEDALDFGLLDLHRHAFRHCDRCRQTLRLSDQASLAEELVRPEDCHNGLLAFRGYDSDLHLARLDIMDRIRGIALREDDLLCRMHGDDAALGRRLQERVRIERRAALFGAFATFAHPWLPANWPIIAASVTGLEKSSAVIDHLTAGGAPRSKGIARAEVPGPCYQAAWT